MNIKFSSLSFKLTFGDGETVLAEDVQLHFDKNLPVEFEGKEIGKVISMEVIGQEVHGVIELRNPELLDEFIQASKLELIGLEAE